MIFDNSPYSRFLKWFWGLFIFGTVSVILFFVLLAYGVLGFMPTFEELENPKSNLATEVITADDVVIGKYFQENRSQIEYEQLSPFVVNALIATEDERFYNHSGIDMRGLGRVLFRTVLMRDQSSGGGSTITQQLAKLLFHDRAPNLWERSIQKLKEWIIAIKLERSYTKEEILTMYLNKAGFIYDAYGIESASKTFFGVSADSLQIQEAAMLVGMLKNPALYNPIRRPELTHERRNVVLNQMVRSNFINRQQFDSLKQLPLGLHFLRSDHKEGMAPYFREYIRLTISANEPLREHYPSWMSQQFIEDSTQWANNPLYGWINKNIKPDGTKYNIYKDGLKIYTTLDSRMQKYAEEAVADHLGKDLQPKFFKEKRNKSRAPYTSHITRDQYDAIISRAVRNSERYRVLKQSGKSADSIDIIMKTPVQMQVFSWDGPKDTILSPMDSILYHKFFLRSGMMSIDPWSGHIKAYVGGPNFRYFMYDMVSQGKRQVGSTIKPFVYTLAMQEGHTPCDLVPNIPQTFILPDGNSWTPRTSGTERAGEMVSLKWGLANSNNNITAWVMKQYSPEAVAEMIHDLGIKSPIDPVPALCLGTPDFSLFEMVGAYNTFANKGVNIEPMPVTHIEDRYGNVVATFHPNKREAVSEETAYLMLNLMQGVIDQGTGRRLRGKYALRSQIAGKTGTSQNHSDGWFMGIVPNLVTGVWVGGEDRDIHFDSMALGQAANMALPIFGMYIQKIYDDPSLHIKNEDLFEKPAQFSYSLDCSDRHLNADEMEGSGSDEDPIF
jgi:penicillin-binding protein 1A